MEYQACEGCSAVTKCDYLTLLACFCRLELVTAVGHFDQRIHNYMAAPARTDAAHPTNQEDSCPEPSTPCHHMMPDCPLIPADRRSQSALCVCHRDTGNFSSSRRARTVRSRWVHRRRRVARYRQSCTACQMRHLETHFMLRLVLAPVLGGPRHLRERDWLGREVFTRRQVKDSCSVFFSHATSGIRCFEVYLSIVVFHQYQSQLNASVSLYRSHWKRSALLGSRSA